MLVLKFVCFGRYELLSMVKKHSNLLGKPVVDEQQGDDACDDVELDHRFWHDVFDLYFVRGKETRGRQSVLLIFLFVNLHLVVL